MKGLGFRVWGTHWLEPGFLPRKMFAVLISLRKRVFVRETGKEKEGGREREKERERESEREKERERERERQTERGRERQLVPQRETS